MRTTIDSFLKEYEKHQRRAIGIIHLIKKETSRSIPDQTRLALLEVWLGSATEYLEQNRRRYTHYKLFMKARNG